MAQRILVAVVVLFAFLGPMPSAADRTPEALGATAPGGPAGEAVLITPDGERLVDRASLPTPGVEVASSIPTTRQAEPGLWWRLFGERVPVAVQQAIETVIAYYDDALAVEGPVVVDFVWTPLTGEYATALGAALPDSYGPGSLVGMNSDAMLPVAVLNHRSGTDLHPSGAEATVYLNANYAWCTAPWGSNGCRSNEFDIHLTIAHELVHGLGFGGSTVIDGNRPRLQSPPDLYDTHVHRAGGSLLASADPGAVLVSGEQLWIQGASSTFYRLESDYPFRPGSSFSHFEEASTALMRPYQNGVNDTVLLDGNTLDVLRQVGWGSALRDGRAAPAQGCGTIATNPTIGSGGGPFAADVRSDVHAASVWRLYAATFRRQPDQGGFDYWRSVLDPNRGGDPANYDAAAAVFVGYEEFQALYGSATNREFVSLLYRNVFGRCPDDGGYAYWIAQLSYRLVTREQLLILWADSEEFRIRTGVDGLRY